jgi:formate hydrogenlyase subunit 3/multisubunit Na+/H+ antiporter MnhD subunit
LSAPVLWIIFPSLAGIIIWFFRKNRNATFLGAISISGILSIVAALFPIEKLISFSFFSANLSSSFTLLGRSLVLVDAERSFLILAYTMLTIWLVIAWLGRTRRIFASVSMIFVALLIAAIAVQPFFYSALIIEVAVLLSILILFRPGQKSAKGILRYLIFQTLAVPCILMIGWLTEVAGTNPTDTSLVNLMVLLTGLGFAFWLAIFPFYSWLPMLSEESDPVEGGFILGMMPTFILFLLLNFIDGFIWLRDLTFVFTIYRIAGIIMVATGGIWAAFQIKLSRLFGYAVIMETGFALIGLSLRNQTGLQFFTLGMFPRMIAFAIWSYTISRVSNQNLDVSLKGVRGLFRKAPWISMGLFISMASLAGIPLFAAFPFRLVLIQALLQQGGSIVIWIFIGILGFLIATFRFAARIFQKPDEAGRPWEGRYSSMMLAIAMVILLLIGIFPNFFLAGTNHLLEAFQYLNW